MLGGQFMSPFLARLSAGAVALVLLGGCFEYEGGGCEPLANGIAGNGNFAYVCTSTADPHCDPGGGNTFGALPNAIARGARFRLRFDGSSTGLAPVSSKAVRTTDDGFVALATGKLGFVVLSGAEATDATRLTVVAPDALAINGGAEPGEGPVGSWVDWSRSDDAQRFRVGRSTTIRAVALAGETVLAGTITGLTWTVDPPDFATILDTDDGTVQLVTPRAGTGRVIVQGSRGLIARARFEVDDGPPLLDGGADADVSDASDDADAADASNDGGDP